LILGEKAKISVAYKTINPKILTEKLEISKRKAEQLLSSNFIFRFEENQNGLKVVQKIYTPNRAQVASWLSFDSDGKIKINDENFKKYIDELNREREVSPTPTVVKIVDGREESRENGSNGTRVSFEKMKQEIAKYFNEEIEDPNFVLLFEEIKSPEQKSYSYTNSQAGLQAKVNEIGGRYNVRISLKQLNGAGWEANYRENESTPSASTYKLFVAIKLFDEMKKGNRNWDTQILGTSTSDCFYQMIILSTNACAEEWIRQFGRTNINNFAYSFGISSNTNFNSYDAVRTSAIDLRKTVEKIYSGEMVQGDNRRIMLEHMNRQKWRAGIPTGSQGKVYDKVGFLWDYAHDAAIVEHPRGTYALSIMTKGANYATIAKITRELEAFMYP
jgi:beta-lactamase class A